MKTVEFIIVARAVTGAYPHRARAVTRDERGQLVGVRILRAATPEDLDRQIERLRGRNAHDDIATEHERPA